MKFTCKLWPFASLIVLLFPVLALLAARPALAQTSLGTISGTVRDPSGAVIAGATVKLTNEATQVSRVVVTNGEGAYRADAVQPGPYTVKASAQGFGPKEIAHLAVQPSIITSQDINLEVGRLTSEVQVQAANAANLDTDTGQLASTISGSELSTLPVMSLNPVELAETVPGVQMVNNGGLSNGIDISVNGTRPRANNYLIDGQDDNDNSIAGQALQANIPDMYSSVTVLTNSYSAEFGRAGGAVVNMVTKSGTNTPHGSAWDLYSGSGLNAIDGQSRGPGASKTRFDQHQYGFTIGAPLLRDRLWAFGAAQWSRFYGKATPNVISLPNPASYALLQGMNNPNANLLLKYIGSLSQYTPLGGAVTNATVINEPGCTPSCIIAFARYHRPSQAQQNTDTQWTTRVDYQATTKDHLSGRFLHDYNVLSPDWFNFGSQLPGFDSYQGGPAEQGGGEYTHIFSPTMINEFRVSVTRINFVFAPLPATVANPLYTSPVITSIAGTGLPLLGPQSTSLPQGRGHDFYQFQDTVSKTFGRHTLRVGADASRVLVRDFVPFNNFGSLSFSKSSGYSGLNNFLDNYLGTSGIAEKNFGSNRLDSHQWQMAFFAQDDIKLTPDFTANVGLRWEFQTDPENAMPYPAINPTTVLTDPITTHYKVDEDRNNFGPRVGFAYSPHNGGFLADGKSVYHAAFGIFYDVLFTNIPDNSLASAPNTQLPLVEVTTGRGAPNATSIIPGMKPSATISPFSTVQLTVNNLVNPLTYEWNFGVERELPGQVKLTVNYVGDRGGKLFANQQYNYFDPATGKRLNPNRGAIVARGNFADSEYNGLQIGILHNFTHGLFIQGSYDYSKALDDGSEVFSFTGQDTSYSSNLAPGMRKRDWGPSVYDHRHYAALTYVWQVPNVHSLDNGGLNEVVDVLTRHWQFSGESFWQSGEYNSFDLSGADFNGDGSGANDRPLLGNPKAGFESIAMDGAAIGCTPGVYFDYGANDVNGDCNQLSPSDAHWVVPYPYTSADMAKEIGRNSFQNPGYWNENWALQKGFGLHIHRMEDAVLQLRAEAQNVFNHNNVGILNTDLLYATPGPGDPFMNKNAARFDDERQLRFWAKFVF